MTSSTSSSRGNWGDTSPAPSPGKAKEMTQQSFFSDRSMTAAFWEFHRENPDVYQALLKLARDWRATGRDRWSINGMFEVFRWQRARMVPDSEEFKMNNNFRAYYARILMLEPDLKGMFEIREQRSA